MRHLPGYALLLLIATVSQCPSLLADQVVLKNGDRLTGAIVKSDAKTLVLKTDAAGDVTFQWAAIDAISSTQPLHLGVQGGQVLVGTVTTADGQLRVASQPGGPVTVPRDSVIVIRSDSEQAVFDAAQARLQHPRLTDFWSGALDTGLSLTSGNSSTVSFTLAGKAVRQTERDKISVYATSVYGRNDNTEPETTTANQIQGGIRVDINLGQAARAFAFGSTDFDANQLQHLNLQNIIAGGAGYHLVKTKTASFDLFGGAGYNQEFFAAYSVPNPAPPPVMLSFGPITQRNAEAEAGEQLDAKIRSRTTVSETFTVFPNLTGPSGYRLTLNSNAATVVNKWLAWQITFADNFLSNPPFGIKGNDIILSTGLRLAFGAAAK